MENNYIEKVAKINEGKKLKYYILTMGCQLNENDSEKLCGMVEKMGYQPTENYKEADLVIFNTCCVRENAEDKLFGKLGELKKVKETRGTIIAIGGCMMQEKHITDKIHESYSYTDIIFGTHTLQNFPEDLYKTLETKKKQQDVLDIDGEVYEGLPIKRTSNIKASVTIMYGCNNFCTYCVVPYVRGRERSREKNIIVSEAKNMIESGYKDITLLGQNVNSYGKGLSEKVNFSQLLREVDSIDGDYWLRFMTSHPKDCSKELIDTIASGTHISKHLHLPFQCGSDRVLKAMNRHYDRRKYLEIVNYAKEKIDGLSLTSDIIVGFPGETYEDFKETLSLIREVEFTSLFTFIFSPRVGTPAAKMDDPISAEEKSKWFRELLDVQEEIAAKRCSSMVGKTEKVLIEGENDKNGELCGRTSGNIIVELEGSKDCIGTFRNVKITKARNWILKGELVK